MKAKTEHINRRSIIKAAAGAAAVAAIGTTVAARASASDPAVIVARQYLETRDRYRALDEARDDRQGEAFKQYPKPPKMLMVVGHPFTDAAPHCVLEDCIDYHFSGAKRVEARRLHAALMVERHAVETRLGITAMQAECDRLRVIVEALFDKLAATNATSVEGVAFKLRALQDWIEDGTAQDIMNGALNDAERIAGLSLTAPYSMYLSTDAEEVS